MFWTFKIGLLKTALYPKTNAIVLIPIRTYFKHFGLLGYCYTHFSWRKELTIYFLFLEKTFLLNKGEKNI